jgi:hypothetical protein
MTNNLSAILFGKNSNLDVMSTLNSLHIASIKANVKILQIILVDDNSLIPLTSNIDKSKFEIPIDCLINSNTPGIAGSVSTAIPFVSYEKCLLLPSHNIFEACSIEMALNLSYSADLVIGYRKSYRDRPILKRINSRIFRWFFHLFVDKNIIDPHGLPIYRKQDIEKYLNPKSGHGVHIDILKGILKNSDVSIIQFPINVSSNHKRRQGRSFRENFPSQRAMILALRSILRRVSNGNFN